MVQITDLVGGEHWAGLRTGLRRSLAVHDDKTFLAALRIHSRLLTSTSHFAVKEAFSNLIETILSWYRDRKLASQLPVSSIDEKQPLHRNLVRLVGLVCWTSRELPRLWIRYPPRYIQEMVEDMVSLISLKEERLVPPSSILALVDPEVGWLEEWFHPLHSRSCLLAKLRRQCSYLSGLLHNLLNTLQTTEFINWKHKPSASFISTQTIELAVFTFNTKFIGKLVSCREGRELVPKLPALITSLINLIFINTGLPGVLGADCLRLILVSAIHQHSEHIDLMLDRVCEGARDQYLIARVLSCVPVLGVDARYRDKMLSFFASFCNKGIGSKELFISILNMTAGFCDTCPVISSSDLKILIPHLIKEAVNVVLDEDSKDSLFIIQKAGYSLPQADPPQTMPCREPHAAGHETLSSYLDQLWAVLYHDRDKGRISSADTDLDITRLVTEAGTCILAAGSVDEESMPLIEFCHERMENEIYQNCILRILIVAASSLHVRIFLVSTGLKNRLAEVISDCKLDDEIILDEKYFLVQHLQLVVGGVGGPREQHLPNHQHPLEDDKPERVTKAGSPKLKQLAQLTHWLDNKEAVFDLGWVEETKVLVRSLLISTNYQLDSSTALALLEGIAKTYTSENCPTSDRYLDEHLLSLIDLMYEYSKNILNLQLEKDNFAESIRTSDELNPCMCISLLLLCESNLDMTRNLIHSLSSTSRTWSVLSSGRVGQCVEWILREEMPRVFVKLVGLGVSPAVLASVWIKQNFLAVLDFPVSIHDYHSYL